MTYRAWHKVSERPRKSGYYVINLVCDDGDGYIDDWNSLAKWDGKEWIGGASGLCRWYNHVCGSAGEARSLEDKITASQR